MENKKRVNCVFEGGGVKGIGLVGALSVFQESGYEFANVAGTSAGAIVAALVAAGYDTDALKHIVESIDYNKIKDKSFLDKIPLLGVVSSFIFEKGIFEGAYFEALMRDLLLKAPVPVRTFKDLRRHAPDGSGTAYSLQVIAADLTRGKMLVLPDDITDYGMDPDELDVARAVRMSMSIPYFFEPVILTDKETKYYIVDGGILSNYPVWLFDGIQGANTIGFRLVEPETGRQHNITGPLSLFLALFTTMLEAHDQRYIKDRDYVRSVMIPTLGVKTTDFDLDDEKRDALYQSGVDSANRFLERYK